MSFHQIRTEAAQVVISREKPLLMALKQVLHWMGILLFREMHLHYGTQHCKEICFTTAAVEI
jgi:hypothetical protein